MGKMRRTVIILSLALIALLVLLSGCAQQTGNLTDSLGKAKCKLNTYSNYMKGRHTGSYYDIAWSNKRNISACCKARNDCVALDGKCYAAGKPYTGFNPKGNDNVAVCEWGATSGKGPRWWFDCDYSKKACSSCKLKWAKGGENSAFGEYNRAASTECCGDDAKEYYVSASISGKGTMAACCDSPDDTLSAKGACVSRQAQTDNSTDADGFLWGTEFSLDQNKAAKVINDTLKTKYIKVRAQQQFFSKDGINFSNFMCLPSQITCQAKIDLDKEVKKMKENGWSLIPMLSHNTESQTFSSSDIDKYVNYVDWFLSRYQKDADIKYVELINHPGESWKGTKEQLLKANNKAYEKIKGKYPNIMVSSPGFEYWLDSNGSGSEGQDKSLKNTLEYVAYFLDKDNGAKFDFWAFHGYPAKVSAGGGEFTNYPPTKSALYNKYAGIKGIEQIIEKLAANGWSNRFIMDLENGTGGAIVRPMGTVSDSEDKVNAAFEVQSLLLSKIQLMGSKSGYGIVALKTYPKSSKAEFRLGSLKSDSSETQTVKSAALLWSKLNEYKYSLHISGEFDNETGPWVEKFSSPGKELYIFFKPFEYHLGETVDFDNKTAAYTITLSKMPKSVALTDMYGKSASLGASRSIAIEAENSPKFLEIEYG